MQDFGIILGKLMPVLLLIGLGIILRRVKILKDAESHFIKKLILNVTLPAVLFVSFYTIELDMSFLWVIVGVFLLNVVLLGVGKGIGRFQKGQYTPFLYSGFEYGMFCVGLFPTAYGAAALPYIAVVALGHELFIWFVYATMLTARGGTKQSLIQTLGAFVKSPVILAIFAGLLANVLGLRGLSQAPLWDGLVTTLSTLGNITGPLILLSIGAGLTMNRENMKFALTTAAIRIPLVLALAYLGGAIFFRKVLGLPTPYEAGLFTLLIAPPPFIIPLFMPDSLEEEKGRINTTLTFMTLIALVLFIIYFARVPVLAL